MRSARAAEAHPAIAIQAVIDANLDEFELEVRRGR